MKNFFSHSIFLASYSWLSLSVGAQALAPIQLDAEVIERLGLVTDSVSEHVVADSVNATGQIVLDPARSHVVTSFFSGQIELDQVQIGDVVAEGQELVRLRSREVAEVISTYIQAASRYESSEILFLREEDLRLQKLTTEESYLAAKAAFLESKASRTAALHTALLTRTRDELAALRSEDGSEDITQIPLKSTIAGTVIAKSKYSGESVETNEELFRIADVTSLLVEMQVPLQATGAVTVGNRLGFQSVIGGIREGEIVISKISPAVSPESLSVRVYGILENKNGEWMPGTPVNVSIIDSAAPQLTAVPTASIVQIGGESHVFREVGSGGFEPVRIELGQRSQGFTEVKGGVAKGEMVVVKGASLLLAAWEERAFN